MAQRQPKSTPAMAALTAAGVEFVAHAYAHDAAAVAGGLAYGAEAAQALGIDPDRVYKTLVVDLGDSLGVAVLPVLERLDLKTTAAAFARHGDTMRRGTMTQGTGVASIADTTGRPEKARCKKATLADPAVAARATGYVVGGISPLGQRRTLPTVVDSSALAHDTIFVSGGRRGLDLELTPTDLIRLTHAVTSPICRG